MANTRKCSVGECTRGFYARGYCELHWKRWWKHGTTELLKRVCTVGDCGRSRYGHGMCGLHYQRWRRTGDPIGKLRKPGKTLEECFRENVDKSAGPNACWPWTGCRNDHGYGLIRVYGKPDQRAHRVACEVAHGPIPDGLDVLHSCDNPPCCNPAHLRAGTHLQNMGEMVQRKRRSRKFSDEVLTAVLNSTETHRMLRERYGISSAYIRLIKKQYVPGMHRSFTA